MPVELVVFDMAGTTVDDDDAVARCLCRALRAVGVEADRQDANRVMGLAKPVAIRKLLEARQGRPAIPETVAAVHRDFVSRITEHYRTAPEVREREGRRPSSGC